MSTPAGSVGNFLLNGSPPPVYNLSGSTSVTTPSWLSDYQSNVIGQANTLASNPAPFAGAYSSLGQNPSGTALASPYMQAAAGAVGNAINPANSGTAAASPYMTAASGSWTDPGVASSWMSPYVSNVIQNAGLQAGQAFSNNVLPSVESQFIGSGQFGGGAGGQGGGGTTGGAGSPFGNALGWQLNQMGQGIESQALAAENQGYNTGLSGYQSQQGLYAGLGQTAGSLATQQQGVGLQGGSLYGSLGTGLGTLGNQSTTTGLGVLNSAAAYPYSSLATLAGIGNTSVNPAGTATNTTYQQPYGPQTNGATASPLQQLLSSTGGYGGLLTGAGNLISGLSGLGGGLPNNGSVPNNGYNPVAPGQQYDANGNYIGVGSPSYGSAPGSSDPLSSNYDPLASYNTPIDYSSPGYTDNGAYTSGLSYATPQSSTDPTSGFYDPLASP